MEQRTYPLTLLGYAESELYLGYDQQRFDEATMHAGSS